MFEINAILLVFVALTISVVFFFAGKQISIFFGLIKPIVFGVVSIFMWLTVLAALLLLGIIRIV